MDFQNVVLKKDQPLVQSVRGQSAEVLAERTDLAPVLDMMSTSGPGHTDMKWTSSAQPCNDDSLLQNLL